MFKLFNLRRIYPRIRYLFVDVLNPSLDKRTKRIVFSKTAITNSSSLRSKYCNNC